MRQQISVKAIQNWIMSEYQQVSAACLLAVFLLIIKNISPDLSTVFQVVYQLYSLSEQKLYFPQKKVFRCTCTAQNSQSLHFSNLSTESWIQGRHRQLSTECWSSSWGARLNCDYSGWEKYSWCIHGNIVYVHTEIHSIHEEKYSWSAGAT